MRDIADSDGGRILSDLVTAISENGAYLSEVDGAIGDGDHGVNMKKGFEQFARTSLTGNKSLSQGFTELGTVLLNEIGGSAGPLYGSLFKSMGKVAGKSDRIDAECFLAMLQAGVESVIEIGGAQLGDKTILDTLLPATKRFGDSVASGCTFAEALEAMSVAAERGIVATKDMVAKVGRASRLGERSRGFLDVGATSCYLILHSMCQSIKALLTLEQ